MLQISHAFPRSYPFIAYVCISHLLTIINHYESVVTRILPAVFTTALIGVDMPIP